MGDELGEDGGGVERDRPVEGDVENLEGDSGALGVLEGGEAGAVGGQGVRRVFANVLRWLRGQDLNLRPSGYEPDELPGCSTPRQRHRHAPEKDKPPRSCPHSGWIDLRMGSSAGRRLQSLAATYSSIA